MIRTVNGFNTWKSHGFLVLHPGAKGNRLITWQPRKKIIAALETAGFTVKNSIPGYEGDTGYTTCTITFCIGKEQ